MSGQSVFLKEVILKTIVNLNVKEVIKIEIIRIKKKIKLLCERGQSTLEYALVMVVAGIISAVLVAVANRKIV